MTAPRPVRRRRPVRSKGVAGGRNEVSRSYWAVVRFLGRDFAGIEALHTMLLRAGVAPRGVRLRPGMFPDLPRSGPLHQESRHTPSS